MKKTFTLLTVACCFYLQIHAQTINIDTSFGNNGFISIPLNAEADDLQILESPDNKLFVYGKDVPSTISLNPNKIYKLNLNGSFDTNFGNNGTLTLPNYMGDYFIIPQGNDNFLVAFQKTDVNSPEISLLRYNIINGSLDTTFGTNGEFKIGFDGNSEFRQTNTVVFPDNSIVVAAGNKFIKLFPNGTIDTSYGNNGAINQNNSGNIKLANSDLLNFYSDKIVKTNTNGNTINSFGNNGIFTYPNIGYYFSKQNNNGNIYTLDFDENIFYTINSNGILSNTLSLTNDNNTLEYYSNFSQDGNKIYFVGTSFSNQPFIVCYDNQGNIVTLNSQNSYKESSISLGNFTSVLTKNNSIYVGGDKKELANDKWYFIVGKYNVSTSTLATEEIKTEKPTFNIFPNPIAKGNTLYFNRVQDYELYDMSGKLIEKQKNALTIDTSKLSTGVYLVKTSEGQLKRIIVK